MWTVKNTWNIFSFWGACNIITVHYCYAYGIPFYTPTIVGALLCLLKRRSEGFSDRVQRGGEGGGFFFSLAE